MTKQKKYSFQQRKPSQKKEIVQELQHLNEQVEELQLLIRRLAKKQKSKKLFGGFISGLANAAGLVIGTLIISGLLIYAGQALVRSEGFQSWIASTIKQAVSETVSEEIEKLPF